MLKALGRMDDKIFAIYNNAKKACWASLEVALFYILPLLIAISTTIAASTFSQFGLHFLPSLFRRVQPPRKRPKVEKKGFKEDPFVFLKDDDEHWPRIK